MFLIWIHFTSAPFRLSLPPTIIVLVLLWLISFTRTFEITGETSQEFTHFWVFYLYQRFIPFIPLEKSAINDGSRHFSVSVTWNFKHMIWISYLTMKYQWTRKVNGPLIIFFPLNCYYTLSNHITFKYLYLVSQSKGIGHCHYYQRFKFVVTFIELNLLTVTKKCFS